MIVKVGNKEYIIKNKYNDKLSKFKNEIRAAIGIWSLQRKNKVPNITSIANYLKMDKETVRNAVDRLMDYLIAYWGWSKQEGKQVLGFFIPEWTFGGLLYRLGRLGLDKCNNKSN